MDDLDLAGSFWLPERPNRRVSGRLIADSNGVSLQLHDALREFEMPATQAVSGGPEWVIEPLVFGRLHEPYDSFDQEMTLHRVRGHVMRGPFATVAEHYAVEDALLGATTRAERTNRISMTFDALEAWVDPPSLVTGFYEGGKITARNVGTATSLHEAVIGDLTYRIMIRGHGSWGEHIHVDRRTYIEVTDEGGGVRYEDVMREWVRPVQDFLMVCLGAPVVMTSVEVETDGEHGPNTRSLFVTQPTQRSAGTWSTARVSAYQSPALLRPNDLDLPFEQSFPAWLDVREDLANAVVLLLSPYYASFIYNEHRYASVFQSAESLAKTVFETSELPRVQHRERVQAVLGAAKDAGVDPRHVDWAERVLRSKNDRPLRDLIAELLNDAGRIGSTVQSVIPSAAKEMASARTGVSHGGSASSPIMKRYWLGEVLTWVLRYHLLRELGMSKARLEYKVVKAWPFERALDQAQRAIDGVS